jgi:hypothetical protein
VFEKWVDTSAARTAGCLRRCGENGRCTLRNLRGSRHSFSDLAEKIAATRSLATNVKLPASEWSRRDARDIDGLSREAEMSGE